MAVDMHMARLALPTLTLKVYVFFRLHLLALLRVCSTFVPRAFVFVCFFCISASGEIDSVKR